MVAATPSKADTLLGINTQERDQSHQALRNVLAAEQGLYLTTLNFHWNIQGKSFIALHELLESHYNWLLENVDTVAERIRALNFLAPNLYQQNKFLIEAKPEQTDQQLIEILVSLHSQAVKILRENIAAFGDSTDFTTHDLLAGLLAEHEKQLWMLNSHLAA